MTKKELRALLDNHSDLSCIADHIEESDDEITEEEARDILEEAINQEDIVYYSRAMRYLMENDPSLQVSIGIAVDSGYETKNLNSEMLASILYQQNLQEELSEFLSENF